MSILQIAVREFRGNWRRNSIFGLILFLSIGVQLFTAISATASEAAVQRYGAAVFGYAETYTATLETPLSVEQLRAFNATLEEIGRGYPWFRPATSVTVGGRVRVSAAGDPAGAPRVSLRAVTPAWRLMTPAIPDDDAWRTVTSDQRLGAAMLLETAAAERLGVAGPAAVTVLLDSAQVTGQPGGGADPGDAPAPGPSAGDQDGPGPGRPAATAAQIALVGVPVFGTYTELAKAFAADGVVNQNLLGLVHAGPQPVQVYWRCAPPRCADAHGLVATAARMLRGELTEAQRVDTVGELLPILRQQREDGRRFAVVVVVLGMFAVTAVASAFVEVRAPQFATLRALGASRWAVGAIALLENLFTAAFVGVLASLLGFGAGRLNPDMFNRIPQVRLDRLDVPLAVFGQSVALTLLIGLVTGLAPAVRAYRSVRTS